LQRVLDDPTDEAARLVYADALLDAGDPRGELITVEHRWTRERSLELARRRAELRRIHGRTWWPEVPTKHVRTRCGFAEAVALPPDRLDHDASFSREPIVELELLGDPKERSLPWPRHLTRIAARSITNEGLALVVDAVGEQLRSLDISGSVSAYWPSDGLPRLGHLAAADSALTTQSLAEWRYLDGLVELDLSCNDMHAYEFLSLLERGAAGLRRWKLSGNQFGNEAARLIAEALPRFPRLELLELLDCDLTSEGVERLRERAPPELTIAFSSVQLARPHSLDHVGGELVFRMAPMGGWTVTHDGMPREITLRTYELYSIGTPSLTATTTGTSAPLAPLMRAIGAGRPRRLYDETISMKVWPLGYDSREPIITADIRVPDEGPIEIDIETYID
jgi:uncharacterized protein (TIGR02996 family)